MTLNWEHRVKLWLTSLAKGKRGASGRAARRLVALVIVPAAVFYACRRMEPATPVEVGERGTGRAVLIATQGSAYKDAVVRALVDHLRKQVAYIRVADVSVLPSVAEGDWDAIVVLHTWEAGKPEPHARAFVERVASQRKLVILTTSGGGDQKMPGVDAVSAASELARAPADATTLLERTARVLAAAGQSSTDPTSGPPAQ